MEFKFTFFDATAGASPYVTNTPGTNNPHFRGIPRGTGNGAPLSALGEKLLLLSSNVVTKVIEAQDSEASQYLATMKERTNQPFQSVPSYLLAYKFTKGRGGAKGAPGAQQYPKGSLSTFARRSGAASRNSNLDAFAGSRNIIVQRWGTRNTTAVSELLQMVPTYDSSGSRKGNEKLTTHIGYAKGVGDPFSSTAYIGWVYFGTKRKKAASGGGMVPRPFIQQVILQNRQQFVKAIAGAANTAIDDTTTNTPSGARGQSSAVTLGQQYAVGRGVRPKPSQKPLRADELPYGKQTTPRHPPYYRKGRLTQEGRVVPPLGPPVNQKLNPDGTRPARHQSRTTLPLPTSSYPTVPHRSSTKKRT